MTSSTYDLTGFLQANRKKGLLDLMEFMRIPSVSSHEGTDDVMKAADWLERQMRDIGLVRIRRAGAEKTPVILAETPAHQRSRPTVVVYSHYDVQPAGDLGDWRSSPFEPEVRSGRLYGRGAGDAKGQVVMHLDAVRALLQVRGAVPINLHFVVDGQEEIGSPALSMAIRQETRLRDADVAVIADGSMYHGSIPSVSLGVRGLAVFRIEIRTARDDLHSGTYGGVVSNPAMELARALAQLQDKRGRIAIEGFYDDVNPVSESELASINELTREHNHSRERLNPPVTGGERHLSVLERAWLRPSVDVHSLWTSIADGEIRTAIPRAAGATLSFRLVPGQNPVRVEQKLRSHLHAIVASEMRVSIRRFHRVLPALSDANSPFVQAARVALGEAFSRRAVLQRQGGSMPVVPVLRDTLGLHSLVIGLAMPRGNAHGPNEWIPLRQLAQGTLAVCHLWDAFARVSPATDRR